VTILAFPFTARVQSRPIFQDRPDQIEDFNVRVMCERYSFRYVAMEGWSEADATHLGSTNDLPDVFVTCIGKIIPPAFLANRTFLNAHPGLLPQNRGVDAFKWSVVNGWPIGVTLHIIDENVDAGWILRRQRVPIYPTDDLRAVADRAYALECDLLADFELWLRSSDRTWPVNTMEHPTSHRRISDAQDRDLEETFLERRDHFISLATDLSVQPHPSDQFVPTPGPNIR
jgi:methionyl-tRNA formyltransferase